MQCAIRASSTVARIIRQKLDAHTSLRQKLTNKWERTRRRAEARIFHAKSPPRQKSRTGAKLQDSVTNRGAAHLKRWASVVREAGLVHNVPATRRGRGGSVPALSKIHAKDRHGADPLMLRIAATLRCRRQSLSHSIQRARCDARHVRASASRIGFHMTNKQSQPMSCRVSACPPRRGSRPRLRLTDNRTPDSSAWTSDADALPSFEFHPHTSNLNHF